MVQKKSKKVLIIFSDFYPEISANLINGAESYLTSNNIFFDKIRVDGSLEIPFVLHKFQNDYYKIEGLIYLNIGYPHKVY